MRAPMFDLGIWRVTLDTTRCEIEFRCFCKYSFVIECVQDEDFFRGSMIVLLPGDFLGTKICDVHAQLLLERFGR